MTQPNPSSPLSSSATAATRRPTRHLSSARLAVYALFAIVLFAVIGITWQLSLYARESTSSSSSSLGGGGGENRRSVLWRLRHMSAGGAENGRAADKAADVANRRHSSSIHGVGAADIGNNNAGAVPSSSSPPRKPKKAQSGLVAVSPQTTVDSEANAVDDIGADENSSPDVRRRVVQYARKVGQPIPLASGVGGEGGSAAAAKEEEEAFVTKYPKGHPKYKNLKKATAGEKEAAAAAEDAAEPPEKKGGNSAKGAAGGGRKKGKKGRAGNKGGKKKGGSHGGDDADNGGGFGDAETAVLSNEEAVAPSLPPSSSLEGREQPRGGSDGNTSSSAIIRGLPYFYNNISLRSVDPLPPVAYALIISNEVFLDGALVLGVSLRLRCPSLQQKTAALSIIVPRGRLSDDSLRRLREEGGFDEIVLVESLAPRAPGAYWKDTFDKLYMFSLTHYKKVVFMDADMICMRSMDKLLSFKLNDFRHVAAIGDKDGFPGTGGSAYFQTGMMVIEPNQEAFKEIMEEFESGVPPRGQKYNRGMNGRDGVLLRNYFQQRFHPIDNKYSRNLNPRFTIPDSVISLHPRGKHKPWFDWRLAIKDPELGKKEFGFPYLEWWDLYEEHVHKKAPLYQYALRKRSAAAAAAAAASSGGGGDTTASSFVKDPFYEERLARYGGSLRNSTAFPIVRASGDGDDASAADQQMSPLTHVWLMRYSEQEYVQYLSDEDRRIRSNISAVLASGEQGGNIRYDWTPEGKAVNMRGIEEGKKADPSTFRIVVGKLGQSCSDACDGAGGKKKKDAAKVGDAVVIDSSSSSPLRCFDQGFHYSAFQNCTYLEQALGCEVCELGVYWRPHPGHDYPASGHYLKKSGERKGPLRCFYNLIRDDRGLPTCSAFNESTTRICPCASPLVV